MDLLASQLSEATRHGLRDFPSTRSVEVRGHDEANALTAAFLSDSTIDAYNRGLRDSKAPLRELENAFSRGVDSGRVDAFQSEEFQQYVERERAGARAQAEGAIKPAVVDGLKLARIIIDELARPKRFSERQIEKVGEALERRITALLGGLGVEVTHPE